jgi:hypothetical protein
MPVFLLNGGLEVAYTYAFSYIAAQIQGESEEKAQQLAESGAKQAMFNVIFLELFWIAHAMNANLPISPLWIVAVA